MPKIKTKKLRVRRDKNSEWIDIPAVGEVLTDDEILRYLIETDTILTVTEDDGSLIADEDGNVLMW